MEVSTSSVRHMFVFLFSLLVGLLFFSAEGSHAAQEDFFVTTLAKHFDVHHDWNRLEKWEREVAPLHFKNEGEGKVSSFAAHYSELEVSVNSTLLDHNGDWVRVSWTTKMKPSYQVDKENSFREETKRYLALMPGSDYHSDTVPIKYLRLKEDDWERGYRDARVLLMGSEAQHFVLVERRDGASHYLAESAGIRFKSYDEPVGVHLAVGKLAHEIVVQWTTFSDPAETYTPWVMVKEVGGTENYVFQGNTSTYSREDMCGSPARTTGWIDPGLHHTVHLSYAGQTLDPATQYEYSVGDLSKEMRGPFLLKTPPAEQSNKNENKQDEGEAVKVNLFAIADMGEFPDDGFCDTNEELGTQPALAVMRKMKEDLEELKAREPNTYQSLLLHQGDISYARGYGAAWHSFFDMIEPLASEIAYMTTIGNHERDWPYSGDRYGGQDSGGECGIPYMTRLAMPRPDTPSSGKAWYSFNYGPIHFLQFSTEHDFAAGSEQYSFILSDLKRVDRSKTPWTVVGFHRPIYVDSTYAGPDNSSDQTVASDLRKTYEQMFMDYHVDLTWVGHHHSYQRTCSVFKEECLAPNEDGTLKAPMHVILGNAGASFSNNFEKFKPSYMEFVALQHGYSRVEATKDYLRMESVNTEGKIIDSFELKPKALKQFRKSI